MSANSIAAGDKFKFSVSRFIQKKFEARIAAGEVFVKTEVLYGCREYGGKRKIDVLIYEKPTHRFLGLECKSQDTQGSTDEKLVASLEDLEQSWEDGFPILLILKKDSKISDRVKRRLGRSTRVFELGDTPTSKHDVLVQRVRAHFGWWDDIAREDWGIP